MVHLACLVLYAGPHGECFSGTWRRTINLNGEPRDSGRRESDAEPWHQEDEPIPGKLNRTGKHSQALEAGKERDGKQEDSDNGETSHADPVCSQTVPLQQRKLLSS